MYPEVEDATLTQAIERIRRVLPYSGIIAVQTELVNQGLRVTRDRVAGRSCSARGGSRDSSITLASCYNTTHVLGCRAILIMAS